MKTIADYTEEEFVRFVEAVGNADPTLYPTDRAHTKGVLEFERLAEHPLGSDLLFYPSRHGIEDSPEAMVRVVKQWRADHGLPGFKVT